MSLDPVNRLSSIVALIQRRQSAAEGATPVRSKTTARSRSKPAVALDGLGKRVMARIDAIAPDDPQRRRKVFTTFIEAALLNELGESLINDAGFHQMVDTISQTLLAEPLLSAQVETAIDALLSAPG